MFLAVYWRLEKVCAQSQAKYSFLNYAGVAQLAEQLICNQQVVGSNPSASSNKVQRVSLTG